MSSCHSDTVFNSFSCTREPLTGLYFEERNKILYHIHLRPKILANGDLFTELQYQALVCKEASILEEAFIWEHDRVKTSLLRMEMEMKRMECAGA